MNRAQRGWSQVPWAYLNPWYLHEKIYKNGKKKKSEKKIIEHIKWEKPHTLFSNFLALNILFIRIWITCQISSIILQLQTKTISNKIRSWNYLSVVPLQKCFTVSLYSKNDFFFLKLSRLICNILIMKMLKEDPNAIHTIYGKIKWAFPYFLITSSIASFWNKYFSFFIKYIQFNNGIS